MIRKSTNLLFLLAPLVLTVGCKKVVKNTPEEIALNEKIKEVSSNQFWVETTSEELEKGDPKWSGGDNYKMVFDENGHVLEEVQYDLDGALRTKETYTYGEGGFLMESNKYDVNGEGGGDELWKYKTHHLKNPMHPELSEVYDSSGELKGKMIRVYDERGNEIEYEYIDIENDGLGNRKGKYTYDSDDRLIRSESYSNNITEVREYTYDNDKVTIKTVFNYGEVKGSRSQVMKYNDKEDVIEVEDLNEGGESDKRIEYAYDYDEKGNWIRKTEYVNGTPRTITERTIEYY